MNALFTFSYGAKTVHIARFQDISEIEKNKFLVYKFNKEKFETHLNEIDAQSITKTVVVLVNNYAEFYEYSQSFFKPINAAGGLVLNEKNEVLIIYRKKKWDLPKGKVEKNETYLEAAKREVEEETGIIVESVTPNLFKTTYHIYLQDRKFYLKSNMWYLMKSNSKYKLRPQASEDIEKILWVPLNDLSYYLQNSFPSIKILFKHYFKLNPLSK